MSKGQILLMSAVSIVSAATGSILTYAFTKHALQAVFEKELQQEVSQFRNFYAKRNKTGAFSDPNSLVKERQKNFPPTAEDIVAKEQYAVTVEVSNEAAKRLAAETEAIREASVVVNFDYEKELASRDPEIPYVISFEEFNEGDDHQTTTLTYYTGDAVLLDEHDEPITEVDRYVGASNLDLFGYGSGDENVVYIRNEKLDLYFEICRMPNRRYDEEVLGRGPSMEHSDQRATGRRPGKKSRKSRDPDKE